MNLSKIFKMQTGLDASISKAHNVNTEDIRVKRIVALLVEVGEFANEYAPFKYWKKNKTINREAVIEEFVDGLHFFSSLAIDLKASENIEAVVKSDDLSDQLAYTFNSICKLVSELNKENLEEAFGIYLGNAKLLNITDEEVLEFYTVKNKVNYERIKNNY